MDKTAWSDKQSRPVKDNRLLNQNDRQLRGHSEFPTMKTSVKPENAMNNYLSRGNESYINVHGPSVVVCIPRAISYLSLSFKLLFVLWLKFRSQNKARRIQ